MARGSVTALHTQEVDPDPISLDSNPAPPPAVAWQQYLFLSPKTQWHECPPLCAGASPGEATPLRSHSGWRWSGHLAMAPALVALTACSSKGGLGSREYLGPF